MLNEQDEAEIRRIAQEEAEKVFQSHLQAYIEAVKRIFEPESPLVIRK